MNLLFVLGVPFPECIGQPYQMRLAESDRGREIRNFNHGLGGSEARIVEIGFLKKGEGTRASVFHRA